MIEDAIPDTSDSAPSPQLAALRKKIGWICYSIRVAAVAWPLWTLAAMLWQWGDRADFLSKLGNFYGIDPASVTDVGYWSAFAVNIAVVGVVGVVVLSIWRLTGAYLDGVIFTGEAAARLRAVAFAAFAATAANMVTRPIVVVLLSTSLLPKMPLYVWIGPGDILNALFSGFVFALGTIFKTAAEIAGEHAQFV